MPPPHLSPELFERLDKVADAVNPALTLWALLALALHARGARARGEAFALGRTLGAWLLAIGVVYVVAHLNRWLHLWPGPHTTPYRFPSGHASYAACIATLGASLDRRWLILAVPLLLLYGALIVYLGYHHPLDIVGALLLAPTLTLLVLRAMRRRATSSPASTAV